MKLWIFIGIKQFFSTGYYHAFKNWKAVCYSETQMQAAIVDVSKGVAVATAARNHGVPRVTLMYKVKGKTPIQRKIGRQPYLTKEEEDSLVKWIHIVGKAGFPVTTEMLLDIFQKIMKDLNRSNPFVNDRPGRSWLSSFFKRNPSLVSI